MEGLCGEGYAGNWSRKVNGVVRKVLRLRAHVIDMVLRVCKTCHNFDVLLSV